MADGPAKKARSHQRDSSSLQVRFTDEDVGRLAQELRDETIAEEMLHLFAIWICADKENHDKAKVHIRELATDQGYATSRIENRRIRQLVELTRNTRRRYGRHPFDAEEVAQANEIVDMRTFLSESPPTESSGASNRRNHIPAFGAFASIVPGRGSSMHGANVGYARVPSFVSRIPAPPLSQRRLRVSPTFSSGNSSLGAASSRQQSSIPALVRPMTVSAATALDSSPPHTPDRPAPLNFRSHSHSTNAEASHSKDALRRSVSTPVRAPRGQGASMMIKQLGKHSSDNTANETTGLLSDMQGDPFDSPNSDGTRATGLYPHSPEEAEHEIRRLLDMTDDIDDDDNNNHNSSHVQAEDPFSTHGYSDCLPLSDAREPQADLEQFTLETISNVGIEDTTYPPQTQYVLSQPCSEQYVTVRGPAPSAAERRATALARRAIRRPALTPTHSLRRPLPLRSLDIETNLPTAPRLVPAPNVTSTASSTAEMHPGQPTRLLPSGSMGMLNRRIGPSNLLSRASTIRAPSLSHNGLSPAAASSVRTTIPVQTPAATTCPTSTHLSEAYRSTASAYMSHLLQQTRARGAQLATVSRSSLNPFEQQWREINDQLLVGVYGRNDVVLTDMDVEYVNRIGAALRVARRNNDWVEQLFTE